MKPFLATWLAVELAIGLFPAAIGMVFWTGGFLLNLVLNEHATLRNHLEGATLVLAGVAGLVGAAYMYIYVVSAKGAYTEKGDSACPRKLVFSLA